MLWRAVRLALKLHIDHFLLPEDNETTPTALYDAVIGYAESDLVIEAEGRRAWRDCLMSDQKELLTLRKQRDQTDGDRVDHSILHVYVCVCVYVRMYIREHTRRE